MTSRNLNAEREEIVRIIGGYVDLPLSSRLAIARSLQGNGFRLHTGTTDMRAREALADILHYAQGLEDWNVAHWTVREQTLAVVDEILAVGTWTPHSERTAPEMVYVREGVCLLCGDGVLKSGEHIDPERHVSEVDRIVSGMSAQAVSIDDRDALACSIFLADLSDKLTIDECAPIADEVMSIFSRLGEAQAAAADEQPDLIGAASAAFKARGGAPDWEEDAVARDLIIRWHLRGFEDGEKFARRPAQTEPTDAQVKAAMQALFDCGTETLPFPGEMRAALKAAFTTGQEEQS